MKHFHSIDRGRLGRFVVLSIALASAWAAGMIGASADEPLKAIRLSRTSPSDFAISPDGKSLVATYVDGTIQLRRLPGFEEVYTEKVFTGYPSQVAFSPDSKRVVVLALDRSLRDRSLRVWDVAKRKELAILGGSKDATGNIGFIDQGKSVVATGNGRVYVWDSATGKLRAELKGPAEAATFTFPKDGKWFGFAGAGDAGFVTFDSATLKPLPPVKIAFSKPFTSAAVSPDGRLLLTVEDYSACDVAFHTLPGGTRKGAVLTKTAVSTWIHTQTFSGDGKHVALNHANPDAKVPGFVEVFDTKGKRVARLDYDGNSAYVRPTFLDGSTLAVRLPGRRNQDPHHGSIIVWKFLQKPQAELDASVPLIDLRPELVALAKYNRINISPDGKSFIASGSKHPALLGSVAAPAETIEISGAPYDRPFIGSGDRFVVAAAVNEMWNIEIREAASGRSTKSFTAPASGKSPPPPWAASSDGKLFALQQYRPAPGRPIAENLKVWDLSTDKLRASLPPVSSDLLSSRQFSPDGSRFAMAGNGVQLFDTADGSPKAVLNHAPAVVAVAFTPDGKSVISLGVDGSLKRWAAEGARQDEVKAAPGSSLIGFTPDGKRFVVVAGSATAVHDSATLVRVGAIAPAKHPVVDHAITDSHLLLHHSPAVLPGGPDTRTAGLRLVAIDTGRGIGAVEGLSDRGRPSWSADGKTAATTADDGVSVWDMTTSKRVALHRPPAGGRIVAAALTPDGSSLLIADIEGKIEKLDVAELRRKPLP